MKITVTDRQTYNIQPTQRVTTDEGYLLVPGRAARSGVQHYLAAELGLEGRNPSDVVGVYRPAEEVFSDASLSSYDNKDVTDEHPSSLVDSKSYRAVAVGHTVSAGRRDGDFVVVDMLVKDQATIDAVNSGKAELSAGYTAEYVPEKGVTDSGEAYEFVQRSININHVAIVSAARAGKSARLFDHAKEPKMATLTLDGRSITMDDESKAALIQSSFDALQKRVKDSEAKEKQLEEEIEALEAKVDAKEEALEAEKAKTTEDALSGRISEILSVRDSAIKLAGEKFSCKSMDSVEVKRAALQMVRPKRDWSDKSPAYIAAAFDEAMESKEEEEEDKKSSNDSAAGLGAALASAKPAGNTQTALDSAWQAKVNRITGREAK